MKKVILCYMVTHIHVLLILERVAPNLIHDRKLLNKNGRVANYFNVFIFNLGQFSND